MILSNDSLLAQLKQNLNQIQEKNKANFYGWRIALKRSQSLQSLFLGEKEVGFRVYQEREVEDQSYNITIYTRHSDPEKMGLAKKTVDPFSSLEEQITSTYQSALLVENQPWDLALPPEKAYSKVRTADPVLLEDMAGGHQKLFQIACDQVKPLEGVKVNSGELYTNLHTEYFETSTGIQVEAQNSDLYFEIAIEKLPLPNTQEVFKYKKAISLEETDLPSFIQQIYKETVGLEETQLPETNSKAVILVDEATISEMFHTLLSQLDAESEYQKRPHFQIGESVYLGEKSGDSDQINLTLDPTLDVMAESSAHTPEGLLTVKAKVIEGDQVRHQKVSNRMSQYLGKEANGIMGNIVLDLGSMSREELISSEDECLEILSFSSLLLDPNTLTWSSEIKLGKLHRKGQEPVQIKGGVVSGNIRENLSNFRFSSTQIQDNAVSSGFFSPAAGYLGPDAMLIRAGVKIAGE